jgi:hypothetical protein
LEGAIKKAEARDLKLKMPAKRQRLHRLEVVEEKDLRKLHEPQAITNK